MTPCIDCGGASNSSGYGSSRLNGKRTSAHRVAYWNAYGPFDLSLDVCHTCDNRRCVNPEHLFLGTRSDNMRDASAKGKLKNCYRWTRENNPNTGVPMSAEKRAAVSRWKRKPFSIVDPDGNIIHGENLTQFCKERGLNQGGAWSVVNGNLPQHKGYTRYIP